MIEAFDDVQWGKVLAEAWMNPAFKASLQTEPSETLRDFARREFGLELVGPFGAVEIPEPPDGMDGEHLSSGAGAAATLTGTATAGGNAQATLCGTATAGGNAQATLTGTATAGGNAQGTLCGTATAGGNAQGTLTGTATVGGR